MIDPRAHCGQGAALAALGPGACSKDSKYDPSLSMRAERWEAPMKLASKLLAAKA